LGLPRRPTGFHNLLGWPTYREPKAAAIVESMRAFSGENIMSLDCLGPAYQPYTLSLFRFITGLLLFQYGIAKIFKFPALPHFADLSPLILTAGTLELVLGGALMIGLFTRISAFILSGQLAFAYFLGHMFKTGEPVFLPLLNGGTPAILFCFACLYLATSGGGPLSVDAAMEKKKGGFRRSGYAQSFDAAE
jgi:putative oxidoreductase